MPSAGAAAAGGTAAAAAGYAAKAAAARTSASRASIAPAAAGVPAAGVAQGVGGGSTPTSSRPEIRAAPYDELRMTPAPAPVPSTSVGSAADDDDDDGAAHASNGRRPAPAPAPAPKKLSAVDFFGLLRAHLPPTHLESLMSALAMFNANKLAKAELMKVATRALRPDDKELRTHSLKAAPVDLMAAFEDFMRKP